MPFDTQSASHKPYVAYVCTDKGAQTAKAVMAQSGESERSVHGGGLSGAARLSADMFMGRTVLAELGNIPLSMACECVAELRSFGADLIVLGEAEDLGTYRALRQAGALEYFSFPVTAEDILGASAPAANVIPFQPETRPGLSVGIVGCKGGVGASLLAQNLAAHAATAKGATKRTALLDADLEFGTQAIDLDRDDTRGLFDALTTPDRVDKTFLGATMEHLNEQLSLYSGQIRAGQNIGTLEPALANLISQLREEFEAVITDIPRGTLLRQPEIAQQLDSLVLVLPAGFAGVNAASRLIEQISKDIPDLPIVPVQSDIRKDAGLSSKDIERGLNRAVVARMPRCDAALTRAHRAAKPLVTHQKRSPWAKPVTQIWAAVTAPAQPKPKTPKRRKGLFG